MAAGPIEVARLARRLFQQAHPERYWSSSSQSIQDPGAPIFATDDERQSFLDMAKMQIARAGAGSAASETADGEAADTPDPKTQPK